ncbi:MAG: hypothetical protein MUE73_03665 [Planctomycetes bacterium]|jgi:hypothetical protein|nr:hypothetical protein [Planctomycetota bacterium]
MKPAASFLLGAALGLVLTPILTWVVGFALFGGRATWAVGQGDGFMVFLVALGAALPGAVLGGATALGLRALRTGRGRLLLLLLSAAIWLTIILLALLLTDRAGS